MFQIGATMDIFNMTNSWITLDYKIAFFFPSR
ncbi:tryptophanase leader peptide [Vibrio sp. 10N.286.49.B1]